MFLDLMEDVIKSINITDLRPRIEHAQIIAPEDIPRFGRLGGMHYHDLIGLQVVVEHESLQSSQAFNLVMCECRPCAIFFWSHLAGLKVSMICGFQKIAW